MKSRLPQIWRPLNVHRWTMALAAASALVAVQVRAAEPSPARILVDAIESIPSRMGGWQIDQLQGSLIPGETRTGASALAIDGVARQAGSKIDVTLTNELPSRIQSLSLWVNGGRSSNVSRAGFQIQDAEGEYLIVTAPLTDEAWQEVTWDEAGNAARPAYPQPNRNGVVDQPIRSVQTVAFSTSPGAMRLVVDGLTARTPVAAGSPQIIARTLGDCVLDPASGSFTSIVFENPLPRAVPVTFDWTLQRNPDLAEHPLPHPTLGFDHARGAAARVSVDGVDTGDPRLTDGSEFTAFESPWGKGYREAVVDLDLGEVREVHGLAWQAADANWIWAVEVSTSESGQNFTVVPNLQQYDLHQKWGRHEFPWPESRTLRYLRLRFTKPGGTMNVIRLPASLHVYDGIENDRVRVPEVGALVHEGRVERTLDPRDFIIVDLPRPTQLGPGSYLLGWTLKGAGEPQTHWQSLFVKPDSPVDRSRTQRFGINASNPALAVLMAECGFGWVRFENGKWQMFCDAPDHFSFDGGIAPWHVNQDAIYNGYQQSGMSVLPYVFQTPEWATRAGPDVRQNRAGYPPRNPADYEEAVFQLVARYGRREISPELLRTADKRSGLNRIQAVELWNEPNLVGPTWAPFVGSLDEYFTVMRAGVDGSRRADPTLPVSSAGWAGTHLSVVGEMSRFRYPDGKRPIDLVDIVNVHFYSGKEPPETCRTDPNLRGAGDSRDDLTFPEQVQALVAWRDENNPRAQIWLTETGNDVGGPIGLSERQQAAKVPRVMMLALAGGLDKVFVYRESGSDASMHAGAGLVRNDGSLRPAWLTTATLIRCLAGFSGSAVRLPVHDPNVWVLAWQEDTQTLIAAWTIGSAGNLSVPDDFELRSADILEMIDAFGAVTAWDPARGLDTIGLTDLPRYFRVRPGSPTARAIQLRRKP